MNKKQIEHKLDSLIQQYASQHRCYYCLTKHNVVGHHLIRRSNLLYRWNIKNILPTCMSCHQKIHNGQLKEPNVDLPNISYKDYLLKKCLTEEEFVQNCYKKLTGKTIEIEKNSKISIKKPKKKKEKTQFEIDIENKKKEYRKQLYQKIKKNKNFS